MDTKLIGIKSSLSDLQLQNKVFEGLELLELYLIEEDFKDVKILKLKISKLIEVHPNLRLMLHSPKINSTNNFLALCDDNLNDYVKVMYNICEIYLNVLGFIVHSKHKNQEENYFIIEKNLNILRKDFQNIDEYLYIENITNTKEKFLNFLKQNNVKNVCFDIANFTANYYEEELVEMIFRLKKNYNVYFHISDNFYGLGDLTPKNIGSGEIDFLAIKEFIDFGIVETFSFNEDLGIEIIEDYEKLKQIFKQEDKVLLQ